MIRLLILSDCHLRERIYTQGKKLEGDAEYSIEQIKKISEIVKPTGVIISGDIFDRKSIDGSEIKLARKLVSATKRETSSPPVFVIQGNHDVGDKNLLEEIEDVVNINNKVVELEGITIGGVDWSYNTIQMFRNKEGGSAPAAAQRPACDILVLHESMRPFSNFGNPNKLSIDDMPVNTFCVVGDTHLPEFITKTTDTGMKYVLSPGCLYPTDKTEFLRESAAVWIADVDKDASGVLHVETQKVPLAVRQAYDFSDSDVSFVLSNIEKGAEGHALKPVLYVDRDDYKTIMNTDGVDSFIIAPVKKRVEAAETTDTSLGALNASFENRINASISLLREKEGDADKLTKEIMALYNADKPNELLEKMIEEVSK